MIFVKKVDFGYNAQLHIPSGQSVVSGHSAVNFSENVSHNIMANDFLDEEALTFHSY